MEKSGSTLLFFVLVASYGACENFATTNPGFRIVITDKGLDYVLKIGIPILEKALSAASIPDISGRAKTPVGHVSYSLTSIKLGPLSIPTSSLTTGAKGLVLKTSGISISATANWRYKKSSFPPVSDHGSAAVSVSGTALSVGVALGADSKGHPTLACTGCSINIGHLSVKFHGGASWLYNLFANNIASALKGSLQDQLCKAAVAAINTDGNRALETLPVETKIDNVAMVNYALIATPVFTSSYIETNHKSSIGISHSSVWESATFQHVNRPQFSMGIDCTETCKWKILIEEQASDYPGIIWGEFQSLSKPVESPVTAPPLPVPGSVDRMMYVYFTDYVANTAAYVYQAAGVLTYRVTPDMVPASSPIKLNTSSFKIFLPQLYKTFPNMGMVLNLAAPKPPNMDINPKSINLTIPCDVNVSVIDAVSKTTKPAFTIEIIVYCDMVVGVHANGAKEIISGNATFLRAEMSLISTKIGTFNVALLQTAANFLSQNLVVPLLNGYTNRGIEIPTVSGVSFLSTNITLGDHYVMVGTDINYKPTFAEN